MDSILDSFDGCIKNKKGMIPSHSTEFYLKPIREVSPLPTGSLSRVDSLASMRVYATLRLPKIAIHLMGAGNIEIFS